MITTASKTEYVEQLAILSRSAVGVIMTHTKEPERAVAALKEFAFLHGDKPKSFHQWDCLRGWSKQDYADGDKDPVFDFDKASFQFVPALKKIADVDEGGAAAWKASVSAMMFPHWEIGKTAQSIQCLKMYAQEFPYTDQRLVLIVPDGFTLPRELENDIIVLDFLLPIRDEIGGIFDMEMRKLMELKGVKKEVFTPEERAQIVAVGAGMTKHEFATSISRAIVTHGNKFPAIPVRDFTEVLRKVKVEIVKKSQCLEVVPPLDIANVAGLEVVKEWLDECSYCFSEEAKAFGADKPRGCALIGPPGTGKTIVCQSIAFVFGLPLIKLDISKLFASKIGESEERLDIALKVVRAMAPVVLWIDEVDKAGLDPRQSSGDSGVGKRLVGKLLDEMGADESGIFFAMSANRVQPLPPEMLRRGRLDKIFAILPPNPHERKKIIEIHVTKRKQDVAALGDLSRIVEKSDGYAGAEIEAAIVDAVRRCYRRGEELTADLICEMLGSMKPVSQAFPEDFNAMVQWAANNATLGSAPAAGGLARTRTRQVTV